MGLAEGPFGNLGRGEETHQPAAISRAAPRHGLVSQRVCAGALPTDAAYQPLQCVMCMCVLCVHDESSFVWPGCLGCKEAGPPAEALTYHSWWRHRQHTAQCFTCSRAEGRPWRSYSGC